MYPDLSSFDNSWYKPGRGRLTMAFWFFVGSPLVRSKLNPLSSLRRVVLRAFGAEIAPHVVIKPGVQVKYPWLLTVGVNSWIGEDSWIDNLAKVTIGSNACISQGAYLCTGNHDWSDSAFALMVKPISIGSGAWVGAKCTIAPGVDIGDCAIAEAGSVVTRDIPAFEIHAGNPARFVRHRVFVGETQPRQMARAASA